MLKCPSLSTRSLVIVTGPGPLRSACVCVYLSFHFVGFMSSEFMTMLHFKLCATIGFRHCSEISTAHTGSILDRKTCYAGILRIYDRIFAQRDRAEGQMESHRCSLQVDIRQLFGARSSSSRRRRIIQSGSFLAAKENLAATNKKRFSQIKPFGAQLLPSCKLA